MNRIKPSFLIFLMNTTRYGNPGYRSSIPPLVLLLLFPFITYFSIPSSSSIRAYIPLIIFSGFVIFILGYGILLFLEWKKFQQLISIFESGAETVGKIIEIYFPRGSGYITYQYQYHQETIRSTVKINQNEKTKAITIG